VGTVLAKNRSVWSSSNIYTLITGHTLHNYFVWWHCHGVLDRIHHALYVECREKLFAMWRYYKKHEESLLARAEREMAQQDRR
jgi:hypothetical protein